MQDVVNSDIGLTSVPKEMGTVDLEELPDSRERPRAPVLWLSCRCQIDVWKLFSDNSFLSAIFDRQGLMVAAPVDLRTKKAESFSPQLLQGFLVKAQEKKSQDCCDVSDCYYQKLEAKRNHMATVPFVLGRGRESNPWR